MNMSRKTISAFKRELLEREARKNWDKFYKRNTCNFFKDRHWIKDEFVQLCPELDWKEPLIGLEAGCGVGNLLFPLCEVFPDLFMNACDFSPRAVQFVKVHSTNDSLLDHLKPDSIDFCCLIFVLSAINPDKMNYVVKNIYKILKTDGLVIFRDYAENDHAMLRFNERQKISEKLYVRQDGTRAYFFSENELSDLFCSNGFADDIIELVHKKTINIKEGVNVPRTFVQCKFRKIV
uniref:Methyltransferase-like protein n=1 Tax=Romanomermis culicivorax TaxID=13658 RepID=A0A915K1P2_ROMCU